MSRTHDGVGVSRTHDGVGVSRTHGGVGVSRMVRLTTIVLAALLACAGSLDATPAQAAAREVGALGVIPGHVIDRAMAVQSRWAVPASVVIALWTIESGFGTRIPPGTNNPFGIRPAPGQPSVVVPIRTFINGRMVMLSLPMRKFATSDEAFDTLGRHLATAPVYHEARCQAGDPARFAEALSGTYSTDQQYGLKLAFVIRTYRLTRFDAAPRPVVPEPASTTRAEPACQ